ncbi:DUF4236 domain-containing protein [Rhodohalobacter halophilus]|uniref:DUF4236 domain-containing protein n=1 Tax=Rhodohalobacter halophilus TaxID=1812810 RepID=UPI00083F62E5|nr:DUF4236 domain-containing protein [Rhodohalobacter halophilus]
MGFFIRKAFKAGPLRINLSKGGVGVSGGVTGARIGLNRNGAYVYGGRHGLYYREKFGQKRRKDIPDAIKPNGRRAQINPNGPTDLFVDTGSTFSSPYDLIEPHPWPELAESIPLYKSPLIWSLAAIFLAAALLMGEQTVWIISAVGLLIILLTVLRDYRWRRKGHQMVESLTKKFEENPSQVDLDPMLRFEEKAPRKYNERFMPDLFTVILQIAMEKREDEYIFAYNKLEKQLPVNDSFIMETKQAILSRHLEAALDDHLLSEEEENEIRELIKKLDLPDQFIFEELQYLDLASSVRKEMERPLHEEESPVPLVQGEICYADFDDVRLLEERVQDRFQKNRVKYRKLGYEIQIDGKLVITDRRMIIYGSGSREYRLNKVLDVITDLESNTIEITISGRKNPIFLTSKYPMIIAARLEKIIEKKVK